MLDLKPQQATADAPRGPDGFARGDRSAGQAPRTGSQRADIAGRLRVAQFDVLSQLAPGSAAIGMSAAVLLAIVFWHNGPHRYLMALIALLATVYGLSISCTVVWYTRPRLETLPAGLMRARIAMAALLGLLWATVPVALGSYADRDQRLMLGYMIAGLGTAGPLMAPVLPAALLFVGPIMCGAAVDALTSDMQVAGSVVGLIIGYGVLVGLATLALNRRFRAQVVNGIVLKEQREIISLLLRDFEESSSDWLWQTDADGRLIDVSDRVAEALGRPIEALEGSDLVACWDPRAADQPVAREAWLRLKAVLASPAAFRDLGLPLRVAGGERWLSLTGKPIHDRDGNFLGFRGVGADITAARRSEARIRHLAANDSLTDLPNRATMTEALRQACDGGKPFALLCVDLDEFKTVNDTLGHAAGDALLVAATQRMRHCLRAGDLLARLGGDEFALLQPAGDAASAEQLGRRLVERLSEPFNLDGVPAAVGASVGVALAPADGTTPDALMKAADLALYRAKHEGRGTLRFFHSEMSHSAQARSALQADLRQALGRGQLSLHYQPVLDLAGERIVVMEALLRWQHPVLGAISPVEFIPIAEEGGLIVGIGTWVLREACAAAAGWRQAARVAVNLSPVQVRDPGLLEAVDAALEAAGLPPDRLELEITESLFLEATEATRGCLHALRARGIRIALDDFGTGYSSLSYLRSFPFDKVKIDRSFVRDIGADGSAAAIVQAITTMAASLGMITTAEGIETVDQEAVLRARGCAQAQGFLYSRPLSAEAAAEMLSGETVAAASIA